MDNQIIKQSYDNEEVVFKIENGVSYVRIDEVAKFCGWTQIKNDKLYIKWERVNEKLKLLNSPMLGNGDFIPEIIMYPLIGMADMTKNTRARDFMLWVGEVLTKIRTIGKYDVVESEISNIVDDKERLLSLKVHQLEELVKIDPTDIVSGMLLNNKKIELNQYLQDKKIAEIDSKISTVDNKISQVEDRFNETNDKISKAMVLREGDMSAEVIAKKLNIFSINNKPHNKFADCMAKVLGFYLHPEGNSGYEDQFIAINLTSRGGVTIPTIKYSKLAFEEMEKYIEENGLHIENPPTTYKRNCKGGKVGDFKNSRIIFDEIEESININKTTYNIYNEEPFNE